MNKIVIVIIVLVLLIGFGFGGWFLMNRKNAQGVRAQLQKADSMEITFLPSDTDSQTYTKKIDYEPQVWLMRGTVAEQNAPASNCGYMGKIQFFQKGKPLFGEPAAFNISPQCRFIAFLHEGKIYRRVLLQEGADYLTELLQELKKSSADGT